LDPSDDIPTITAVCARKADLDSSLVGSTR
jgi:hypothetical protein